MIRSRALLFLITVGLASAAQGYDLPAGYELGPDTLSPDGRYGLLYPTREVKGDYPPNLLVQLAPYKQLAEIRPGVPQGRTLEVFAEWSGSSIVAIYQFKRWGLVGLWVYELKDGQLVRTHPIMDEVRKIFARDLRERLLKKYPKESETIILVSPEGEENPTPEFQIKGRKVLLDLYADNKPNMAAGPNWTATLKATWSLDKGAFEKTKLIPGEIKILPQAE